jgi:hypothetical protein
MGPIRGALERTLLFQFVWQFTLPGRIWPGWAPAPPQLRAALAAFTGTESLINRPGPKYVFAHSMLAHWPFMVNGRCEPLDRAIDMSEDSASAREAYVASLRCTNRQVLATVSEILRKSAVPPIIILQSDHGPRRAGTPWEGAAEEITAPQAIERMEVFGAYYLPGGERVLADTTTPVNVMRAVLSHYLGADLPPLPDRSLHATSDHPYRFAVVPDSIFEFPLTPALAASEQVGVGVPLHP